MLGLCYGGALVLLLLFHLAGLIHNRVLYANGTFVPQTVGIDAFELNDQIELREGRLVTLGGDPQLHLRDPAQRVDTIEVAFEYTLPPLEEIVFYAAPGQAHSVRQMVYPTNGGQGRLFWLPPGGGQSLRLDPGTVAGNVITVHGITLNQPRPWYAHFVFSPAEWLLLALLPGLLACALVAGGEAVAFFKNRRKGEKA